MTARLNQTIKRNHTRASEGEKAKRLETATRVSALLQFNSVQSDQPSPSFLNDASGSSPSNTAIAMVDIFGHLVAWSPGRLQHWLGCRRTRFFGLYHQASSRQLSISAYKERCTHVWGSRKSYPEQFGWSSNQPNAQQKCRQVPIAQFLC